MPAEKQNNISDKLNAMRGLPEGFSFQPERIWNRLEPQLKKSTVNYRAVFFAAASFIAVIIFISLPKKQNDQAGAVVSIPEQIIPDKTKIETVNRGNIDLVSSEENIKPNTTTPERKWIVPNKDREVTLPLKNVAIKPYTETLRPEEISVPEIKSETKTAIAVKPKHRFPIAHANELNSIVPVEEDEPVIRSKSGFAFRKHSYDPPPPVTSFEEGFTDRKKPKSIFPLLNSSQ
jgi:hypothetical protein